MNQITINFIEMEDMRYESAGDYWITSNGDWQIVVVKTKDWRHQVLVSIHELAEMALVVQRQIPITEIDEFDITFEKNRKPGDKSEPGDAPGAPYRPEHFFATNIERLLAAELSVDWAEYGRELDGLTQPEPELDGPKSYGPPA